MHPNANSLILSSFLSNQTQGLKKIMSSDDRERTGRRVDTGGLPEMMVVRGERKNPTSVLLLIE